MEIPWQKASAMNEIQFYFKTLEGNTPSAFDAVREMARQINRMISGLDPLLDNLCGLTCPGCGDNCCARATIWYDFRDLVYLYFGTGYFPRYQIGKKSGDGGTLCVHLCEKGCLLPRKNRPFVCTWYLCSAQKDHPSCDRIQEEVTQIKALRKEMETLFIRAS